MGIVIPEQQHIAMTPRRAQPIVDHDAARTIGDILDQPPALIDGVLRGGTRMTQRWRHGEFHAYLPGLPTHVLMTYYGAAQQSSWRQESRHQTARTLPGTVTIIPAGQDGRWEVHGTIEVSHVYLPDARLQEAALALAPAQPIELLGRICVEDPIAARILDILSHEASQGDTASALFAEQTLDLLCLQLVRAHSTRTVAVTMPVRKGLADWQVRRVTQYMKEFLDRIIRLEDLAELVNLSRHHVCTAFRLATGQTPHEWLTALRMTQAQELLAKSDLPVTHVALAVGYQTPSSFTATFRRATGMTPTAFRLAR